MTPAREQTQQFVIEAIAEILPGSKNRDIYIDFFSRLSDEAFDALMQRMDEDQEIFPFYHPNFTGTVIDVERVINLIEKHGDTIMEQLWDIDPETGLQYLTPLKYPVLLLPLRIQQQKLQKKMSIPKDNNHIDDLTNQPTTESKGASLSYPEVQIIYAMGGDKILEETMKVRGGDEKAFRDYNNEIIASGGVTIGAISSSKTKVKSTKTVQVILEAMHLSNNLAS
ncbi:RNA polymerase beta subunit [Erwinia phage Ea35-70]|jgi:hypothetical protein|uniref:Virion structural protein n=1 Tax=Erwinia phage Ea35-70 TaxID=1429768 RepID=W6B1K7_9CAUD|nr:RNA polymerase beta subunit [Erwinia phage Ea35-70]AHI60304.1 hypothetical protein Ea357_153 [Erwinia phage Ea35-70]